MYEPIQKETKKNSAIPQKLQSNFKNLTGHSLDNVTVHYNSSKPAQLNAFAYTQGNHIHIAPGQEKHLPHELTHVAQQMEGKVKPTNYINGIPINDSKSLEAEADFNITALTSQRKTLPNYKKSPSLCFEKYTHDSAVQLMTEGTVYQLNSLTDINQRFQFVYPITLTEIVTELQRANRIFERVANATIVNNFVSPLLDPVIAASMIDLNLNTDGRNAVLSRIADAFEAVYGLPNHFFLYNGASGVYFNGNFAPQDMGAIMNQCSNNTLHHSDLVTHYPANADGYVHANSAPYAVQFTGLHNGFRCYTLLSRGSYRQRNGRTYHDF